MAEINTGRTIGDYVALFRRRWIYPAIVLPSVLLLAIFLAYALPPEFRSTGTILLEPSSIPEDIVQSTVTSYADEQMEIVRQRVMTTDRLEQLITQHDPYPDLGNMPAAAKARQIAEDTEIERVDPITLEPLEESTAFSIHYNNPDPEMAKLVADELVELFLSYNRQTRTERAQATHGFLLAESKRLGTEIRAQEERLAQFKSQHGAAVPDNNTRNLLQADRLERELMDIEGRIRTVQERESLLAVQLGDTSPMLFDSAGDWRGELAGLKVELADAQQRYTPDHPDVKRLKRSIEALSARVAAAGPQNNQPDNPEYLHVNSQLQAARGELAALRGDANRIRNQLDSYRGAITAAPDLEREYADLQRDYEITQDQFKDIQNKLQAATIAQTLESEQKGERFTLIRSPRTPESPFFPNRLGMILLGFVLAVALSIGLAALAENSDQTVRGSRDVSDLTDISVIGAVPMVLNPQDVRKRALAWGMATAAFAVALLIVGVTVVQA
jgi:succinoglycan biosynthesis transport protein ExoP